MKTQPYPRLATGILLSGWLIAIGCEGKVSKPATPVAQTPTPAIVPEPNSAEQPMLTIQPEPFGQTEDGKEIKSFNLRNRHGMKVGIINRGGIITSVEVPDRDGKLANVTLTFATPEAYLINGPYFGGICGRYANRIAEGQFAIEGEQYQLAANNGVHHLHGGIEHFMKKLWKAESFQNDKAAGVKLTYTSPDGEEGFPGTLKTVVTYSLNDDNELRIDYEATVEGKPTVLNLTNHAYWNLAGAANGTVLDQELTLFCDKYLPVDEGSIPTGELSSVSGTCMDFTKPEKIGTRINETVNGGGGYDHCYVVNGKAGELRPTAKIVDPKSGRVLEISTTEPGVQFYTGNHLKGTPETGNAVMHGAFCLETQHFPDSPNRPEFPTTRLNPGETYRQTTVHKFSVDK